MVNISDLQPSRSDMSAQVQDQVGANELLLSENI